MRLTVRGVRSIEIEMSDPDRAAEFYVKAWHLQEIDPDGGVRYLRGTGVYHHILSIRKANDAPSLRRITFDAADRGMVDQLHLGVSAASTACEMPHEIDTPGGGYGFGFTDPGGLNLAVVCSDADDRAVCDVATRHRKTS